VPPTSTQTEEPPKQISTKPKKNQRNQNQTPKQTQTQIQKENSVLNSDLLQSNLPWINKIIAIILIIAIIWASREFYLHCDEMAGHLSEPQIVLRGSDRNGKTVIINDFMESYEWLRDKTAPDARVLSWWDYGYQINGVANRTTIADGNTWNHEHIALLGKSLVSNETEAHQIMRHLADYVLIWTTRFAGMHGDDIAKMPHMANIAGSVYPEVSQKGYYLDREGNPSPLMRKSLLYQLTFYQMKPEVATPKNYKEVFKSKNMMVRIYRVLNTAKRTPFGKYSPALKIGQFKQ
jgi:dolichyl-diphosphooligosaccharide--protein glycosyltransferase